MVLEKEAEEKKIKTHMWGVVAKVVQNTRKIKERNEIIISKVVAEEEKKTDEIDPLKKKIHIFVCVQIVVCMQPVCASAPR